MEIWLRDWDWRCFCGAGATNICFTSCNSSSSFSFCSLITFNSPSFCFFFLSFSFQKSGELASYGNNISNLTNLNNINNNTWFKSNRTCHSRSLAIFMYNWQYFNLRILKSSKSSRVSNPESGMFKEMFETSLASNSSTPMPLPYYTRCPYRTECGC